jgi:hypothetical protein
VQQRKDTGAHAVTQLRRPDQEGSAVTGKSIRENPLCACSLAGNYIVSVDGTNGMLCANMVSNWRRA